MAPGEPEYPQPIKQFL